MSSAKQAARNATTERLGREQWLEGALNALAVGGINQVRVEVLARALGVTKGSFYWHFKDRAALLDALLKHWRAGRTTSIDAQAQASGASGAKPAERLRGLLDLYLDRANPRGMAIELAIRDWARRESAAADAVAAVDKARLAALIPLYRALGHDPQESGARALALYAFIFGQSLIIEGVSATKGRELRDRCARLLIG